MKPKNKKKKKAHGENYRKIMKGLGKSDSKIPAQNHQWSNPGDFFTKFSLYKETPNTITSFETTLISSL